MLADDARLELVNRLRMNGREEVGQYYHRYAQAPTAWRCQPGFVDGRAAILMSDPNDPKGAPAYFVLLEWRDDRIAGIRDFIFARYAIEGAEVVVLEAGEGAFGVIARERSDEAIQTGLRTGAWIDSRNEWNGSIAFGSMTRALRRVRARFASRSIAATVRSISTSPGSRQMLVALAA